MEQFDARMKSLLKDEYDDFKNALLEKPVKGLYLNRNKKQSNIMTINGAKKHMMKKCYLKCLFLKACRQDYPGILF